MKLNDLFELTGYKNLPAYKQARNDFANTNTHNDAMRGMLKFDEFMRENGFQLLGSGGFAKVYERQGYPWVFKIFTGDPAYRAWLQYVVANQGNEHVPKIRGNPFKIISGTYAIRMEKLTPLPDNYTDDPLIDAVMFGGLPLTQKSENTIKDAGHPDLVAVLKAIMKIAYHNHNYDTDLHRYNAMMRGNTLVITDPLMDHGYYN